MKIQQVKANQTNLKTGEYKELEKGHVSFLKCPNDEK